MKYHKTTEIELCRTCAEQISSTMAVKCHYCDELTHWACTKLSPVRLAMYVFAKCHFRCEQCAIKQIEKYHQNPNEAIEKISEELKSGYLIANQNSRNSPLPSSPIAEGISQPFPTLPLQTGEDGTHILAHPTTSPTSTTHHTTMPTTTHQDQVENTPFSTPASSPLQVGRTEGAAAIENAGLEGAIETLISNTRNNIGGQNTTKTRTCKFFLRDKCRYSTDECKYLHKIERKNIICKFYKEGICKYANCAYVHPPICKAFLQNKRERPNGCFRGGCELFHPSLCYDLERQGDCLRKNCRFYHRTNAYYQGKKWTDDKVNESRSMHESEGKYDNNSRWANSGVGGARPKTNNHLYPPLPTSRAYRSDADQMGNLNQNLVQYKCSYNTKLKSGIHESNDKDFLLQEMAKMLRNFQCLLEGRPLSPRE